MAVEVVAGRALAPYVGMSLYSWTMIIAVVLAGLSFGHWLGGVLSDRTGAPARVVALSLFAAAATTGFSLAALRLTAPLATGFDPISHTGALTIGAFLAPSLFAGMISPPLTAMALSATPADRHGRVLGRMFALGAFGAILGTLLAGLVLISWLGTSWSIAIIALVYALLALPFFSRRIAPTVAMAVVVTGGALAPERLGLNSACDRESAYYCIRTDDTIFMGVEARVMALDHLAHGVNARHDPQLLLTAYVQGVDELARLRYANTDFSAFFVGGGAYSLPRAWASRRPEGHFIVAEVDPDVTGIAESSLWLEKNKSLTIQHKDARIALNHLPKDTAFDVIFGDAFHDIAIPQHLVTDEFHVLVKQRLNPDGMYIVNVVDTLRRPLFLLSLARTLRQQFGHVELWLDVEQIQLGEARTTWIMLASDRPTGQSQLEASYGFGRTWVQAPLDAMIDYVGRDYIVMLSDDFAPVDRLLSQLLNDVTFAEN